MQASESVGGQQLFASLKALREVVDANLLLYAMEEIRGVMKELKSYTTVQIKANEKAGTVKAVCKYGEYTCTVTLTVPPAYPEEPVGIKLARCNFPGKCSAFSHACALLTAIRLHQSQSSRECCTWPSLLPGSALR